LHRDCILTNSDYKLYIKECTCYIRVHTSKGAYIALGIF
jgi:hypothetical protein